MKRFKKTKQSVYYENYKKALPRASLVTIYKLFIKPHLDYGGIVYDQTFNNSFHERLDQIQYNSVLGITGAISFRSREKLYQELDFQFLRQRRWFRKLCRFLRIINQSPKYLSELIPTARQANMTRHKNSVPLFNVNPLVPSAPFLYPLKTSFHGVEKGCFGNNCN